MISVLIVEKDPMVLQINKQFLNSLDGFEILDTVTTIEEAILEILESSVDLILLANIFSFDKGVDFLKWIRNNNVDVDVIFITADKSTDTIETAFRYGAVDYILKPFTFERFKFSLENYKLRKLSLSQTKITNQDNLDRLINSSTDEKDISNDIFKPSLQLSKGLNENTYSMIMKEIHSIPEKAFTAQDLAKSLGMARVTVRRYLEHMQEENSIDLIIEYGKVGRPKHSYIFKP